MMDFESELGQAARRLLAGERVVWLTTVDSKGVPQPRPVWFIWDEDAVLIYSRPTAAKLAHIRHSPQVAVHFNSDPEANENVLIIIGRASILDGQPSLQVPAYMQKYAQGIQNLGMTPESFSAAYSAAVRITPERLRDG